MIRLPGFAKLQRGDTIVEVLIAMALVSVVLSGAYAVTTQDLRTTQDANERSQALALVQQQVELIRAKTTSTGSFVLANQCLDGGLVAQSSAVSATPNPCNISPSNAANCTASFCYNLDVDSSSGIFAVTATWPNQHGTSSTVNMSYKPV